jgi:hypothetical protein
MSYYKKNPLTNNYGLHSPKKYDPANQRPLPVIKTTTHPCSLCNEYEKTKTSKTKNSKEKTIITKPNLNPLALHHEILIWKNHKEKITNKGKY